MDDIGKCIVCNMVFTTKRSNYCYFCSERCLRIWENNLE